MTSLLSSPQSAPNPETPAGRSTSDKDSPSESGAAPPPTFDVLPLSSDVRATLAEMGYVHPTPVQIAVFEPAKRGKDLVVQARTGTGKTAAFGLPIVDHIVKRSVDRAQVLVLTPTRELALQVGAEVERLGKRRGVKVTAIYGGAPMQRQIDAIAAGAQVICGTPGRVLDHLRRGTLDPRSIRLVVLDESDEMLSMGFERELTAILEHLPAERQTLLFSATLPPDIERIAKNKLRSPEFVTLSGDHVGALSILHFVYMVSTDKTTALLRVIEVENPESAIIFCNTKDETERLAGSLVRQGFEADWLNGDLDQGEREKVMSATREGRLRFLVATDVAARGIDISHLTHVINFDFPQDAESYVHRTGRTGRAGRTGTAIALVTPHDIGQLYLLRLTYKIRPIEKQIPSETELKTRAEADIVAMFAEAYGKKQVHPDDLSLARRLLTHDSAEAIVAGLLRDHLGARPTAREEASAARRAAKPRAVPVAEAAAAPPAARPPQPEAAPAPRPERIEKLPEPTDTVEVPVVPRAVPPAEPAQDLGAREEASAAPSAEPAGEAAPADAAAPAGGRPFADRPGRREDCGRRGRGDRGPRDFSEGARDRAAAGRPLDRARPLPEAGPHKAFVRHADFTTWQPPEEEGDDEPIRGGARRSPDAPADEPRPEAAASEPPQPPGEVVELHVTVGRRDGARAADLVRALEKAGLPKDSVQRVRVRERHAFLTVRKEDEERAIAALSSTPIAGRTPTAERARERAAPSAPEAASEDPNAGGDPQV